MRIVELFSGCGGFSLGDRQAGLQVVAAFDNDPVLASSYPINFPDTKMYIRDVAEIRGEELCSPIVRIDRIVGGPPCQSFSSIGTGRGHLGM